MSCANNLKQIGQATQTHLSTTNHFPTDGWSCSWIGVPDRGAGRGQPGGWIFNILPFIEQKQVYMMYYGQTGAQKQALARQMIQTPLDVFNCPSRRPAMLLTFANQKSYMIGDNGQMSDPLQPGDGVGRADYACNAGDDEGPDGYQGFPNGSPTGYSDPTIPTVLGTVDLMTGVIYEGSMIRPVDIRDGTAHTLLVAEKYMNKTQYYSGTASADNENMYIGDNEDIRCFTGCNKSSTMPPGTTTLPNNTYDANTNPDPSVNFIPRRDSADPSTASKHYGHTFGSIIQGA